MALGETDDAGVVEAVAAEVSLGGAVEFIAAGAVVLIDDDLEVGVEAGHEATEEEADEVVELRGKEVPVRRPEEHQRRKQLPYRVPFPLERHHLPLSRFLHPSIYRPSSLIRRDREDCILSSRSR